MTLIQLYRNGNRIIASDGIMYIDGRHNLENVKREVINRNKRYAKNFPHKIADAFNYKNKIVNL